MQQTFVVGCVIETFGFSLAPSTLYSERSFIDQIKTKRCAGDTVRVVKRVNRYVQNVYRNSDNGNTWRASL